MEKKKKIEIIYIVKFNYFVFPVIVFGVNTKANKRIEYRTKTVTNALDT